MSWWQFSAVVEGWLEANTTDADQGMTQQDEDDLWQGVMERM